jgi:hypothetical protein
MEAIDRDDKITNKHVPNYNLLAVLIFFVQIISWIFYIQHWPFATLMKFFFFPLALGFFIHWIISFRLSVGQKILSALGLIGSFYVLADLLHRILRATRLPQLLFYFIIIAIFTFTLFSLYTNFIRKKKAV